MSRNAVIEVSFADSTLFAVPAVHFQVQFALEVNRLCGDPERRPDAIAVELHADVDGAGAERHPLRRHAALSAAANAYSFEGTVETDRPASDYVPRVVPANPEASVPLEAGMIAWYR